MDRKRWLGIGFAGAAGLALLAMARLGGDGRAHPAGEGRPGSAAVDEAGSAPLLDPASGVARGRRAPEVAAAPENAAPPPGWRARLVRDGDGRPVAGARVLVTLLHPQREPRRIELVSDPEGRIGPLPPGLETYPAASVAVAPGESWAAARAEIELAHDGREHVLRLGKPPGYRIAVVDAEGPLPGARVTLTEMPAGRRVWSRTADAYGSVVGRWSEAGAAFRLAAEHPSRVPTGELVLDAPLHRSEGVWRALLFLARAATLRVRVVDEAGAPRPGCTIALSLPQQVEASRVLEGDEGRVEPFAVRTRTDAAGSAAFVDAPASLPLLVSVRSEDGREAVEELSLAPGENDELVVVLPRPRGSFEVHVRDEAGSALAGARVGRGSAELGRSDARGVLAVPEPPPGEEGSWWAWLEGHALAWSSSTASPIVLRLARGHAVAGRVVGPDGRPAPLVQLTPLFGEPRDTAAARERGRLLLRLLGPSGRGEAGARTDARGRFRIEGLPPRLVDLHVRPPKSAAFHVPGIEAGREDLRIVLADPATIGEASGVRLLVTIVDAEALAPVPGARISAFRVHEDEAGTVPGPTRTADARGHAELRLPEAGAYRLVAWADGYLEASSRERDFPVGTHAVELRARRAGVLRVRVRRADGRPAAGLLVGATTPEGERVRLGHEDRRGSRAGPWLATSADGEMEANRAPTGTLRVEVRRSPRSAALATATVEVRSEGETIVELALPPETPPR